MTVLEVGRPARRADRSRSDRARTRRARADRLTLPLRTAGCGPVDPAGHGRRGRGRTDRRHRPGSRGADRRLRLPQRRRGLRPAGARRLGVAGCACRASTPPACSARSSAATPGRSGSRRSTSASRPARRYLPGTMILETSWGTPTGWIIVRDVLLIGPWHHAADRSATYRRTPNDYEAEHILLRTIRCVSGEVQTVMDCEPVFDYGRQPAQLGVHRRQLPPGRRPTADGQRRQADPDHRHAARLRGRPGRRPHPAQGGRHPVRGPVVGRRRAAHDYDDAYARLVWTAHHWQHWLARGQFPDHPWRSYLQRSALTLKGLTYAPTGAIDRGRHHVAAGDPRRQPQLRLPLHLDPRRDVRPVGDVLPRLRLGGGRLLLVHRRPGRRRRRPADHVRHRRRAGARRVRARPPARLRRTRGRSGSATRRTPSSSTTSGARCWTRSTCTRRPPTTSTTGSGRSSTSRSARRSSTGASPTPASGRSAAS